MRRCPNCRRAVTETCAYGSCFACRRATLCALLERAQVATSAASTFCPSLTYAQERTA